MFQPILIRLARELDRRSIPYMVIGGQAVLVYGEPRFTRDIDVTLGIGPERLNDILDLVKESGWKILVEAPQDFVAKTMVLPCQENQGDIRIDFVFSFSPYEAQAMERVRRVPIGGQDVRFASPEDLVIHKIVAGRPRDLEDIRNVLAKNPAMDKAYIRRWLADFTKALTQPLSERFENVLKESEK